MVGSGNLTVMREPLPTPSLSPTTAPPWSSTTRRTMQRPIASPAVAPTSVCRDGSNSAGKLSAAIPRPSSSMTTSAWPASIATRTSIRPPCETASSARVSKLRTRRCGRARSPMSTIAGAIALASTTPRSPARAASASSSVAARAERSTGVRSSWTASEPMRETSSSSSRRWSWARAFCSTVASARSRALLSSISRRSSRGCLQVG